RHSPDRSDGRSRSQLHSISADPSPAITWSAAGTSADATPANSWPTGLHDATTSLITRAYSAALELGSSEWAMRSISSSIFERGGTARLRGRANNTSTCSKPLVAAAAMTAAAVPHFTSLSISRWTRWFHFTAASLIRLARSLASETASPANVIDVGLTITI